MMKKKVKILIVGLTASCLLCGCKQSNTSQKDSKTNVKKENKLATKKLGIEHELEFGGTYIKITINDFEKIGFKPGDSVDIEFSNGKKYKDIPFYTGYFTGIGEPVLVAYPGYPYIKLANNFGSDLFKDAGFKEKDTAKVTLRKTAKYEDVEKVFAMKYSNNREDYKSDDIFANARALQGGNLKEDMLYRSASPCDLENNKARAPYGSKYAQSQNIEYIVDLSDDEEDLQGYNSDESADISYWKDLYNNNQVLPASVNANYRSDDFKETMGTAIKFMTGNEGKILIHCTEGKDRTGFVCALIEAAAGCDLDEIEKDYMITYDNYFGINKESDPKRYAAIRDTRFKDIVCNIAKVNNLKDITKDNLKSGSTAYFKECGLIEEEIDLFVERITK